MNGRMTINSTAWILMACLTASCAGMEELVSEPRVSLRQVKVTELALNRQTFVLDFDVTNPNPFPLPIKSVSYGVELDGQRFASGATQSAFSVPAGSDGAFAISVSLNLLQTAPRLLFIVRDGVRRDVPYKLEGRFEVDMPFVRPLSFSNTGTIRLQASDF